MPLDTRLKAFISACEELADTGADARQNVAAAAPLMLALAACGSELLTADQKRADPVTYARNAIHLGEADGISLFALVWRPGQWTPIHDHSTWGVVGVLEGVLEERNYIPAGNTIDDGGKVDLQPGGITLLAAGAVATFVPNPDHIHITGVPEDRETAISLHLYGRLMNSYHCYDLANRCRRLVDVAHVESR
jgi:predicted metal-dependent enzyme (double-stranded beta helix superfamily)